MIAYIPCLPNARPSTQSSPHNEKGYVVQYDAHLVRLLLTSGMVIYIVVHNYPEVMHKIRHTLALHKNSNLRGKLGCYGICAGIVTSLLTFPILYYVYAE